jgi:hypothetical protein
VPYFSHGKQASDDCPNCEYLAQLVIRRCDGNYFEAADRLGDHFGLRPKDKLKLRVRVRKLLSVSPYLQHGGKEQ